MCAAKFVRTSVAPLLAHVLGPALGIEPRHFFDKHLDLIRSEQARKER